MACSRIPLELWREIFEWISMDMSSRALPTLCACAKVQKPTADEALRYLYTRSIALSRVRTNRDLPNVISIIRWKWATIIRSALPHFPRATYHRPYYMYLEPVPPLGELYYLGGDLVFPLACYEFGTDNYEMEPESVLSTADSMIRREVDSWLPCWEYPSNGSASLSGGRSPGEEKRLRTILHAAFCNPVATQLLKLVAQTQRTQGKTTRLSNVSAKFLDPGFLLSTFEDIAELRDVGKGYLTKALAEQFARHPSPPRVIMVDQRSIMERAGRVQRVENANTFFSHLPPDVLTTLGGRRLSRAVEVCDAEDMRAIARQTRLESLSFAFEGHEMDALGPIVQLTPCLRVLDIWGREWEEIPDFGQDTTESICNWLRTLDNFESLTMTLSVGGFLTPLADALLRGEGATLPRLAYLDIRITPKWRLDLRLLYAIRLCRGLKTLLVNAMILVEWLPPTTALDVDDQADTDERDVLEKLQRHSIEKWEDGEFHKLVNLTLVCSLQYLGLLDNFQVNGIFFSVGQLDSILAHCPALRKLSVRLRRDQDHSQPVGRGWVPLLRRSRMLEEVELTGLYELDPGDLLLLYEESDPPRPSGKLLSLGINNVIRRCRLWESHPGEASLRERSLPLLVQLWDDKDVRSATYSYTH